MHVEYNHFYSSHLGKDMEFKEYGHSGKPMIVFPSSGGRFYEYEDFKMIDACAPFINEGLIRVYTPDSIDNETWLNKSSNPYDISRRHLDYDNYITKEFIPYIQSKNNFYDKMIATGCSMGGFHSANFYFRHPDVFDTVIALSGIYDIRFFVGENLGTYDVYLNSPIDYLRNLEDQHYLDAYRSGNIIICTGQGAFEEDSVRDTKELSRVLREKNIPAWVDFWGLDVNHDWPWWRLQMQYFLNNLKEKGKLNI